MKHSWTYLVLIIILLSCSKKTETHVLPLQLDTSRFEKTPDGHLTLSSALVVAAIRYKLIRESTKDVRSQLLNDNGLKIHNTTGTLFTTPKHPFSRLPGFTSFSLSDRRCLPSLQRRLHEGHLYQRFFLRLNQQFTAGRRMCESHFVCSRSV